MPRSNDPTKKNEGVLRRKIKIDEFTGKPIIEEFTIEAFKERNMTRKNLIDFLKERADKINKMDD